MIKVSHSGLLGSYYDHLVAEGRGKALRDVVPVLMGYADFLQGRQAIPVHANKADVEAYRGHLASPDATQDGRVLELTTQGTRLGIVRAFHAWMLRRGLTMMDPACKVSPPKVPRKPVSADLLTQQEARAILFAAATPVEHGKRGTRAWAIALRDLAMLAIALTTGRRVSGLCSLRCLDLDEAQCSLRVDREKGSVGRVLPVAKWAVSLASAYREQARPVLLRGQVSDWLFPGKTPTDPIATRTWDDTVRRLHRAASAQSPALTQLGKKVISTHSLRVSFAAMLFRGGCDIRVINELMLHAKLSTTARYTPLGFDDLRLAMIQFHPLAAQKIPMRAS